MTQEQKKQLTKRLKSFAWRYGLFLALMTCNFLVENVAGLGLPVFWATTLSYFANEGTKYLNRYNN